MRLFFIISFFINIAGIAQQPLPPIGQWREHLPYNSAIDVTAGDGKVYCATPYSLFSVNISDNAVERLSRVTGLNETGISAIKYDGSNNKLFIEEFLTNTMNDFETNLSHIVHMIIYQ